MEEIPNHLTHWPLNLTSVGYDVVALAAARAATTGELSPDERAICVAMGILGDAIRAA